MAYNFLGLVNDINARVNEVPITESNFSAQNSGVVKVHKDAVNAAIRDVNQQEFQWPFNYVSTDLPLVAGTNRYTKPATTKSLDMESFRIQRNDTFNNDTIKLRPILYEEYLDKYVDDEYNTDTSVWDLPRYIFQTQDQNFGVYPIPDEAYTLTYESFSFPSDLSSATDVPNIPEQFRYVINDASLYHAYMFRADLDAAQLSLNKFRSGLDAMRKIYINRYLEIRDTRVPRTRVSSGGIFNGH